MSRIFITGASGFLGASVVRAALREGCEVSVLLRTGDIPPRLEDVIRHIKVVRGDLDGFRRTDLDDWVPDVAIHLAWQGVANSERNNPAQLGNVKTSVNVAEVLAACGCRKVVGIGSQAEYGPQRGRIDEFAPTLPTTVYGAAKLISSVATERICAGSGVEFAWLRLFSCYGPGDSPGWMIPDLITNLRAGARPPLTLGEQRWDYVFVDDAAEAILRVALSNVARGVFNLGSGVACRIREVAEKVRDFVAPGAALGFGEVPYRQDQVMHLQANISKLVRATGWLPRTTLDEGLRLTVASYLESALEVSSK